MPAIYRLGRHAHKHHPLPFILMGGALLVTFGVLAYKLLHLTTAPRSHIVATPPKVTHYSAQSAQLRISESTFTLDLPANWKKTAPAPGAIIKTPYTYKSSSVDARQLAVYVDVLPETLAVNRVVAVNADGITLRHEPVSDNCANYTQASKTDPGAGVPAKWRGVNFICDIGNYQRNLVGTASTQGINQVRITGSQTGSHRFFMTFTDNSADPNYNVFYTILDSFSVQ